MIRSIFTEESFYVDYDHPLIQEKAKELFAGIKDDVDKAKAAYLFVRDEIPHSFDIHADTVNAKASDVLRNRTGICHAKSNLLAALLRSQGIPAGFCFQHLTLNQDDSRGYCIHGYNAVFLNRHWIKLDARGNKPGIKAEFSLTNPILAFPNRKQYDEYDIPGIFAHPRAASMHLLENVKNIDEVATECTALVTEKPDIEEITVRPFEDNDMELFQTWLNKPYVAKYYRDPQDWIDELEKRHTEFGWITHRIVELAGKPIGFCQYYLYKHGMECGEDWQGSVSVEGTYSLDYMIGEADYIGKGYGRQIALKLIQMIQHEGDGERIIVQPEEGNAPSCNTLLSSGFRYDAENRLYIMEL